jgi:hypothetical protein
MDNQMLRSIAATIAFSLLFLSSSAMSQAPGSPEAFERMFASMFDGAAAVECGSLVGKRRLAAENALNAFGMKESRDIETVKGLAGYMFRRTMLECAFDGKSPFDMGITMTASDQTIVVEIKDGVISRITHTFGIRH